MYSEPWFRKHDGWFYCYVREGGKRRQVKLVRGKENRDAAYDKWHQLCAKPVEQPVVAGDAAVGLLDLFLAWVQKNRAQGTYDIYLHHLTSFSRSIGHELAVTELKPKHVTAWLDTLNVSDSTKAGAAQTVRTAFHWLVREGHISVNPVAGAKAPSKRGREVILTEDQYQAVLERSRPDFRQLLEFIRATGCRPQEAAAAWPVLLQKRSPRTGACSITSFTSNGPSEKHRIARSNTKIEVWGDATKSSGGPLTIWNGKMETNNFSSPEWIEWPGKGGGTSTFTYSLWDARFNRQILHDSLVLTPFNSIVIVMGGEFQVPRDPPINPASHGMFNFAIEEYREGGFDVYMYDEDDSGLWGEGPAYDEIVTAINDRGVTDVAIMGYSHGGGSTYTLAWRLEQNQIQGSGIADITNAFWVPFTGYVDAIKDGGPQPFAETRRPALSLFHCAQYQDNDAFLSGDPSGGDDDINRTYLGVVHTEIDDHAVVIGLLRTRLRQKVMP